MCLCDGSAKQIREPRQVVCADAKSTIEYLRNSKESDMPTEIYIASMNRYVYPEAGELNTRSILHSIIGSVDEIEMLEKMKTKDINLVTRRVLDGEIEKMRTIRDEFEYLLSKIIK